MIGIYKITSPTGKVYIGQSVNIQGRLGRYRRLQCEAQARLHASLLKYGFSTHVFEILEECEVEELNVRERYYQDFYNVLGPMGLNCKIQGTNDKSGYLSEETVAKNRGPKGPYRPRGLQYKVTCPHCAKEGGANVMRQWHFDACKDNPEGPKGRKTWSKEQLDKRSSTRTGVKINKKKL